MCSSYSKSLIIATLLWITSPFVVHPTSPPVIPHPVQPTYQKENCLSCHQSGGYVKKYKAYTPITPHPNWKNCRQCHVPKKTPQLFKKTTFKPYQLPYRKSKTTGIPPVIPHAAQNRQNCISCHSPQTSKYPTPHPYYQNCIQCHVYKGFKNTKNLKLK